MGLSNSMQARQDQTPCTIVITNGKTWEECLSIPLKLSDEWWAERCGGMEVPYLKYVRVQAELNHQSRERSMVSAFLDLGYSLCELEVEFSDSERRKWGICRWYREHANYQKPISDLFTGSAVNDPSFYYAVFKTEHACDQEFGLYSTQMMASAGILLHKTIVYRKVVFSPPKNANAVAA